MKDRDHDFLETVEKSQPVEPVPLNANDPLYTIYTSGTTGDPKGVLRDNSHAVHLKYSMSSYYSTFPGETFFAASDIGEKRRGTRSVATTARSEVTTVQHLTRATTARSEVMMVQHSTLRSSAPLPLPVLTRLVSLAANPAGWVVGHSYIVYAPLLQGCTSVLFEGKPVGTPDAGEYWRVIEKYKVSAMFTAPTALRAIRRDDPNSEHLPEHDISSLRACFVAGERADPDTIRHFEETLGIPVVDHWWQTESGSPMCGVQFEVSERAKRVCVVCRPTERHSI